MPTILVVEDNAHGAEMLMLLLDSEGYRVVHAGDGEEALAKAKAEKPDLITLDVRMPKMDGFEVCRRLRADPATAQIPVLMVTAMTAQGDLEQGLAAGADDFISKPVRKLELVARVRSLIRAGQFKSELDRTLAYLNDLKKL